MSALPTPFFAQAAEDIVWLVFLVIWAIFQVVGGARDKSGKRKGRGSDTSTEEETVFQYETEEAESEEERRTREIQEEIRRRIEERRRLREAEDGRVPTAPPEQSTSESASQRQTREAGRNMRDPVTSSRQKADADRASHAETFANPSGNETYQNPYQKAYAEQIERLKETEEKARQILRSPNQTTFASDAFVHESIEATEIGSAEIGGPEDADFWSDSSEARRALPTMGMRNDLLIDLADTNSTRKAILLMEILGPCKANAAR